MIGDLARPRLIFIAVASIATTVAVSVLAVAEVISEEWFFGAPLIGAGFSSISLLRNENDVEPSGAPTDVARRFTSALRLLEAEREIQETLEEERRRTLFLLEGEGERSRAAEHLGWEYLTQH
ncbi:MAG: hypothetical protein M3335_05875, partial [Actinomycetota bacterium]|nr:hypothetical protein [Actinomycetota bacterium]